MPPKKIAWGISVGSRKITPSVQPIIPPPSSNGWIPKLTYVGGGSVKNITGSYDATNVGSLRFVEVVCHFTVYDYASPIGSISFYIVLPTVTPYSIPKIDTPAIISGNLPILVGSIHNPIYMQETPGSPNMVYASYVSFNTSPIFITPTSEDITITFVYSMFNPD